MSRPPFQTPNKDNLTPLPLAEDGCEQNVPVPYVPAPEDDLPQESADALIQGMKQVIREVTGAEASIRREMLPRRDPQSTRLSLFVVTMPEGITEEQRSEADDWLREDGPLFRYEGESL